MWQANDAKFEPLARRSFLAAEAQVTSQDLSAIASAGLAALGYLAKGLQAPRDWQQQQRAILQRAAAPKAQLLLIPVPAVGRLVDAAAANVCTPK